MNARLGFAACVTALAVSAPVFAKDKTATLAVVKLNVFPKTLKLTHVRDARSLLVTGVTKDGRVIDLTPTAKLTADGKIATVDADRYVTPKAKGKTQVTVSAAGLSVKVPVEVTNVAKQPVNFSREIMPILSKVGCNAGTCHGARAGKNGFKLSLRGYDADFDYRALVDDLSGRRFNRSQPAQSLMLLKPTNGVPHQGGFLFDEQSRPYHMIEQWIAEGCKWATAPKATRLEVFPKNPLMGKSGEKLQQLVIAHYADGTTRDVTRDAHFKSSNFEVATVTKSGEIETIMRGESAILIRYEGTYVTNPVTVLGNRDGFAWNNSPEFNFIDKAVNAKLRRMKILPSELCTDAEFIRRVKFDLCGIPPTADEVRKFLADKRDSRTKRLAKIDEYLNSPEFIDHWTLKWSDLLMSNSKYIKTKGVWAFRNWIRNAIATNKPYDQFVFDLMTASGSTFENPAANYYRVARTPEDVMENMTQVFIGTRFMCAKCHDHPFEKWTQTNYYQLSAFFAQVGRKKGLRKDDEIIYTLGSAQPVYHAGTGQAVQPIFPYDVAVSRPSFPSSSLGTRGDRRKRLAEWLTSPKNPFFAESLVNRYWSYFTSRGIIDPVDDIRSSNPPVNPALLKALTQDFIQSKFDLKRLVKTIVTSHTYQRSFRTNKWNDDDAENYSHASPRRLAAEQLYDAIMIATGAPFQIPGAPAGFHAAQLPDPKIKVGFLDMFGRPPRESPCECERSSTVSLGQTLNLVNGPTIGNAIAHPQGLIARSLKAKLPPKKLIEAVYLSVINRYPTKAETARSEKYFAEVKNPKEAAEDLMWALINSPAFLFNR
jgi:Protein of unknown function (DUF1549)/Protein of unknown function (DUF1553)